MAVLARAAKIFTKKSIIMVKEKTVIIVARTCKKNSTTNFNKREKHICINDNVATFI